MTIFYHPPRREHSRGWIIAGLIVVYAIIGGFLLASQTGCSTYLSRVEGTDGQLYPATKLNVGLIGLIGSDYIGASVPEIVFFDTLLAVDLVPSVATDTLLLPVDLCVALKKELTK